MIALNSAFNVEHHGAHVGYAERPFSDSLPVRVFKIIPGSLAMLSQSSYDRRQCGADLSASRRKKRHSSAG